MTEPSGVSLGGETLKGTVAKFSMAAVGFAGTVVFARLLGPTDFGGFYLLFALVKFTDRPISGVANAAKKRFSETTQSESEVLGAMLLVIGGWLVVVVAAAAVGRSWLAAFTGLDGAVSLFVLLVLATMLYEPLERLVEARGRIGASTWIDTVRSYLTLPLQLSFVLAGFGAAGMAFGLSGATFLTVPVTLYYVDTRPAVPPRDLLANLWSYARYSVPSALLGKAYDRFDVFLLGIILVPSAVGYYEVAAKLTVPATFVSGVAARGLMAKVSNLRSKGESVAEDVSNTIAFTTVLSVPILFGALALSRQLVVTLYGGEYAPAAELLVGLAVFRTLQTLNGPLRQTINGIDCPRVNTWLSVGVLTLNVAVGVVLTLEYGAIGVVVATVLAETVRYVGLAAVLRRALPDVVVLPRTFLQQVVAGVVMFGVVTVAVRAVPVASWVELTALVGLGAAVYGTVLFGISPEVRLTGRSVLEDVAGQYWPGWVAESDRTE